MEYLSTHPLLRDTKLVVSGSTVRGWLTFSCTASQLEALYASTRQQRTLTWLVGAYRKG